MSEETNYAIALKAIIDRHPIPLQDCNQDSADRSGCPCKTTDKSTVPPGYHCIPDGSTGDMGYLSKDVAAKVEDSDSLNTSFDMKSMNIANDDNKMKLTEAIVNLSSLSNKIAAKMKELENLILIIQIFNQRYHEELVKND